MHGKPVDHLPFQKSIALDVPVWRGSCSRLLNFGLQSHVRWNIFFKSRVHRPHSCPGRIGHPLDRRRAPSDGGSSCPTAIDLRSLFGGFLLDICRAFATPWLRRLNGDVLSVLDGGLAAREFVEGWLWRLRWSRPGVSRCAGS